MDEEYLKSSNKGFPMVNTTEGLPNYGPEPYVVPPSQRPRAGPDGQERANIPVIDLARMRHFDADQRTSVIQEIGAACLRPNSWSIIHHYKLFFLQILNHGIPQPVLDRALSAANEFFKQPISERNKFKSGDVHEPVRYSTNIKDGINKVQFWRLFLKHYAHPLHEWIHLWPKNPPRYREQMGKYCTEVRKVALELMEAITESLGLGPKYMTNKMEDGMQVMAVNCYPPCPNPDATLGLPPHSDYGCLTVVLQDSDGLEIKDREDGRWKLLPELKGALQVHVGDHLEVLSNGIHKSVIHRAVLNPDRTRISIASLHSLGMDEQMGPAKKLADPKTRYKESSFRDFLNFLSKNDIVEGSFIDTLKISPRK